MPIVITPTGEYINSETGNPVNLPPQRPDMGTGRDMGGAVIPQTMINPESVLGEGQMARENIPANMDMGMDSEMRAEDISDVEKVRMLIDMGLPPADAMEAVAREKEMNQNPVNPEAFSGGAVAPAIIETPAGVTNVDPSMGGLGALPTPRGAKDMGMPENGMVADLMRRGYTPDMISAMAGGNMPPREDDAMNLERTTAPTPMR